MEMPRPRKQKIPIAIEHAASLHKRLSRLFEYGDFNRQIQPISILEGKKVTIKTTLQNQEAQGRKIQSEAMVRALFDETLRMGFPIKARIRWHNASRKLINYQDIHIMDSSDLAENRVKLISIIKKMEHGKTHSFEVEFYNPGRQIS